MTTIQERVDTYRKRLINDMQQTVKPYVHDYDMGMVEGLVEDAMHQVSLLLVEIGGYQEREQNAAIDRLHGPGAAAALDAAIADGTIYGEDETPIEDRAPLHEYETAWAAAIQEAQDHPGRCVDVPGGGVISFDKGTDS